MISPSPAIALLKRELLSILRNPRYFLFLAAILVSFGLPLFLFLGTYPGLDLGQPRIVSYVSMLFFLGYGYALYILSVQLLPAAAANSICVERQRDLLDLLRMSYITPFTYLLAKAASILGLFLLCVIATLPFASTLFYFTGVDWLQFSQMLFLVLATAGSNVVLGLYCSARFHRTIPAVLGTFFMVILAQAILPLTAALVYDELAGHVFFSRPWPPDQLFFPLTFLSVFVVAERGFEPLHFVTGGLYHGFLVLFFGWRAYRALLRPERAQKLHGGQIIDDPTLLEARRKKFPYYLIDPCRRRALIPDGRNPVVAKERYMSLANRGTKSIRLLYTTSIISLVIGAFGAAFSLTQTNAEEFFGMFLLVDTGLVLLIAPALVATAFAKEHEWSNWDMLQMTLLRPTTIVWGKLAGAVQHLSLPVAALLIGLLPFVETMFRYPDLIGRFAVTGLVATATILYAVTLSLAVTVRKKTSFAALATAYGAVMFALGVLPLLCGLVLSTPGFPIGRAAQAEIIIAGASPLVALWTVALGFEDAFGYLVAIIYLSASFLLAMIALMRGSGWAVFRGHRPAVAATPEYVSEQRP